MGSEDALRRQTRIAAYGPTLVRIAAMSNSLQNVSVSLQLIEAPWAATMTGK
jgi:hypothetical protein